MTLPANEFLPERVAPGRQILALLQRHVFLLLGSWPRLIEVLYWPTLNMIIWGFINLYLMQSLTGVAAVAAALLAGAIFWDVMIRSQVGMLISFLEEMWSRNLGHIFVAPVSPYSYAAGLMLLSLIRTAIAMLPAFLLAAWFFGYRVWDLGLPAIGFYLNLALSGWCSSLLLIALLYRYGMAAEWLAWMLTFVISPFAAIYYPVSALPEWLHPLAWSLPPTYVFEGMRAIINDQIVRWDYMGMAVLLNFVFLGLSLLVYKTAFEATRKRGGLLQMGE